MGFSFHSTGRVKSSEERWNESRVINNGSPRRAAKTEEKPAGLSRRVSRHWMGTTAIPQRSGGPLIVHAGAR
jgi:hypothetical protein